MSKRVEQFIQDYTRNCSNEINTIPLTSTGAEIKNYLPWLTPDHARAVAEIAREEVTEKVELFLIDNLKEIPVEKKNALIEELKK